MIEESGKISRNVEDLSDKINKFILIYLYREIQPTNAEYKFFSRANGTFAKIDIPLDPLTNYWQISKYWSNSEYVLWWLMDKAKN